MMIANRESFAAAKYSAKYYGYVERGLVHMWDGIDSAGKGTHATTAGRWKDLVGGVDLVKGGSGNIVVLADGFRWAKLQHTYMQSESRFYGYDTSGYTMEVVARANAFVSGANDMMSFQYDSGATGWNLFYFNNYAPAGYKPGNSEGLRYVCFPSGGSVTTYSRSCNPTTAGGRVDYINGASTYTDASAGATTEGVYLSVGALRPTFMTGRNSGNFDMLSIRIYNRALTAAEIAANYAIDTERFGLT